MIPRDFDTGSATVPIASIDFSNLTKSSIHDRAGIEAILCDDAVHATALHPHIAAVMVDRDKFKRTAQAASDAVLLDAQSRLLTWTWPR